MTATDATLLTDIIFSTVLKHMTGSSMKYVLMPFFISVYLPWQQGQTDKPVSAKAPDIVMAKRWKYLNYLPVKNGLRFSAKAVNPSEKS
jgi:hypothetical protein